MKRKTENYILRIILHLLFCLGIISLFSCSREAATIVVPPVTGNLPAEDTGTLYPVIQNVYPGTLQSLDIPQSYPSNVSPDYPGIAVVFSHLMENANNEIQSAIELIDVSSGQVSINLSSANISSKYFTISPVSGSLRQNTEYVLRIYKYAAADTSVTTASVSRSGNIAAIVTALNHGLSDNELISVTGIAGYNSTMVPVKITGDKSFSYNNSGADQAVTADTSGIIKIYSHTLVFDNLITPPATTISPADPLYVEYKFRTGTSTSADITPPTIDFTSIMDGDSNIDPDPVAGNGYIEIIFDDDKIPMIDPSTVNDKSVILYNITGGVQVTGYISFISADTDFKTFRFYPYPDTYLLPLTEYRLRVSVSSVLPPYYYIRDFAGNSVEETDIYFSTGL